MKKVTKIKLPYRLSEYH